MTLRLRPAEADDLPRITEIYGWHVENGLASFEEVPPDLAEMTSRFRAVKERGLPFTVAITGEADSAFSEGDVLGYAYAGPYRPRPAYRHTLEDSVYVHPAATRRGVGAALLAQLLDDCAKLGYRQMVAIIGDSDNRSSIELHRKLGFKMVGILRSVGFKLGRWVDSALMQRALGPGDTTPPGSAKT